MVPKPKPATTQQAITLLSEDFESDFPQSNNWTLYWFEEAPYVWDNHTFKPHSGSRSAWCAAGQGSTQVPALNPATDNYPDLINSWMVWGPFDLSDALDARLQFWYWNDSEEDFDFFGWYASTDGQYFYGNEVSGNSNGWQSIDFSLAEVPDLGSLVGLSQVWVALTFLSDDTIAQKGAFVDDIVLTKQGANVAPTIAHTPVALGNAGAEIQIAATITDDDALQANLHYRKGGSRTFQTVAMTQSSNTFTGVIPASEVTSRGLEYYLSVSDGQNTTNDPATNFDTDPHRIRVRIASLRNPSPQPNGSAQTAYRMISIPTELNQARTDSVLLDDLGPFDDTKWRLFGSENGSFFEFPDPKTAAFSPGKAFWLIVSDANKIIDAGSGTSTNTAQAFTITLQPGWNDIGLPFDFPVNWAEVQVDRAQVDGPYLYEGTWQTPSSVSQLAPWKGYAVKNLGSAPLSLSIPPVAADATPLPKVALANHPETLWSIQLKAECGQARDEMNFLGWSEEATSAKDVFDYSEPPMIGEYVTLYFPHEEWPRFPGRYTSDFRSPTNDGDVWRMVVETNVVNSEIRLSWEGLESLPSNWEAALLEGESGVSFRLAERNGYVFQYAKSKEIFLVVGGSSFVEQEKKTLSTPKAYALEQNYPNPFNPSTTIAFSLPRSSHVTLKVLNLLGEEVATLIDKRFSAGRHETHWDASGYANGVYFYRLEAEGNLVETRKLVLLK